MNLTNYLLSDFKKWNHIKGCQTFEGGTRDTVQFLTDWEKPVDTNSYMCDFFLSDSSNNIRCPMISEADQFLH